MPLLIHAHTDPTGRVHLRQPFQRSAPTPLDSAGDFRTRRELSEPPWCLYSWPYGWQIDHPRRLLGGAHLSPASASATHLCATQHSAASADLQCSPGVSQAGDTGPYSRDSEIAALIDETGTVEGLKLISGHPFLVKATFDAVKRWIYQPAM